MSLVDSQQIAVVLDSSNRNESGFDPLLRWAAGILLAPFIIVLLVAVLSPFVPLSARRRTTGIACALVLVSIVVTDWPFRLTFEMHRPALNRAVARVRSGQVATDAGPVRVGLFSFKQVRLATNGNLGFQLTGGAGGGMSPCPPPAGSYLGLVQHQLGAEPP